MGMDAIFRMMLFSISISDGKVFDGIVVIWAKFIRFMNIDITYDQ